VSADLNKMATSFNCTVRDGQISARIDSRKKVLYGDFN